MRQRARVEVEFFVYDDVKPASRVSRAGVFIVNNGGLPAYVTNVAVTKRALWQDRVPGLRAAPFRWRRRWWWPRWDRRGVFETWKVITDDSLLGRLDPGESKSALFVDIVDGLKVPLEQGRVEELASDREWAIVETGIRRYVGRVSDNRPLGVTNE